MKEIVFLSVEDVVIVHASAIEHEGGMGGTRDHGLLDAAVAMPRQQFGGAYFQEDVAAMAAAYLFHIAQHHPFFDGNKGAAVMSAFVFLDKNGIDLIIAPKDLEAVTRRIAAGNMAKVDLIRWMQKQIGGGNGYVRSANDLSKARPARRDAAFTSPVVMAEGQVWERVTSYRPVRAIDRRMTAIGQPSETHDTPSQRPFPRRAESSPTAVATPSATGMPQICRVDSGPVTRPSVSVRAQGGLGGRTRPATVHSTASVSSTTNRVHSAARQS